MFHIVTQYGNSNFETSKRTSFWTKHLFNGETTVEVKSHRKRFFQLPLNHILQTTSVFLFFLRQERRIFNHFSSQATTEAATQTKPACENHRQQQAVCWTCDSPSIHRRFNHSSASVSTPTKITARGK